MDDQHLFDELVRAAEKLGIEVRIEPFETPASGGGGGCVLRGERLVLLDAGAPLEKRIRALARALSTPDTETIYMTPEVREIVEKAGGTTSPQVIAADSRVGEKVPMDTDEGDDGDEEGTHRR